MLNRPFLMNLQGVVLFLINVTDCGPGVPAHIAGKIFEPFITDKKKGTGLGLSISKKRIEAHSGKLEYRNNSTADVTFRITLPVRH